MLPLISLVITLPGSVETLIPALWLGAEGNVEARELKEGKVDP